MDPISISALIAGASSLFSGGAGAAAAGGAFSGGMFSSLATMGSVAGGLSSTGSLLQMGATAASLASQMGGIFQTQASKNTISSAASWEKAGIIQQNEAVARASEYNATIALRNAEIARFQGEIAAEDQAKLAYKTLGAARAGYAASGITSNSGSAVDVLSESAANAARDRNMLKFSTDLRIQNFKDQANLDNMSAQNARTSSLFGISAASNRQNAALMNADSKSLEQIGNTATTIANSIPIYQSAYNNLVS